MNTAPNNTPSPELPCASTCPYCGVGCGVIASTTETGQWLVTGDDAHPANRGSLCIKGSTLADTQTHSQPLRMPLLNGTQVDWDTALDAVAAGFAKTVAEHGPDAVAFYLSGQLLTEDYYVANKLMKGFIGSANVDTNSRLCMASAVAAHKRAFGEDVVPCSYDDLDECDLLVMVGSNAAWTHPVLYQRIAERQARGELQVVVIDPRRTATCEIADLHLAIKPGSDVALFNALLSYLWEQGCADTDFVNTHTSGSETCLATARSTIAQCALATGLNTEQLQTFFAQFAAHPNTITFFSQGVNQSSQGTDKANAIINCHLLTGRIGRPGSGPFSITGQPNAMGGREVGGMANQLAAHMDFTPEHIDRVARFWNAPNMAQQPGHKAIDMFDAVANGTIKAIWIMGTNPVVSLPNSEKIQAALARCPLVVISDCVANTDTMQFADIALPARGWGEKDGTVTNSERTISRQRAFSIPTGGARADWDIVCAIAKRLGYGEAFSYRNNRDIFIEHAALTGFENKGTRQLDLSALAELSTTEYERLQPIQWPLGKRPFAQHRFSTDDQRARFIATVAATPLEQPTEERPLIVNSGRVRDQWHTMTRTGSTAKLFSHRNEPFIELAPEDAAAAAIAAGDLVEVAGSGGSFHGIARIDGSQQAGQLFVPIHWSGAFTSKGLSNRLFVAHTDPFSGQPESKHGAVRISRVKVKQWLRAVCGEPLERAVLDEWDRSLAFWSMTPGVSGVIYDAAVTQPAAEAIEHLQALTGSDQVLSLQDTTDHASVSRILSLCDGKPQWLLTAATQREALASPQQLWEGLQSSAPPWQALALANSSANANGPMICTCFEVHQGDIVEAIHQGADNTEALGATLCCGTNCGSCVPELKQLIRSELATDQSFTPERQAAKAGG